MRDYPFGQNRPRQYHNVRYPLRVYKKWEIVHRAGIQGLDIAGWYVSPVHRLATSDLTKVDYHRAVAQEPQARLND